MSREDEIMRGDRGPSGWKIALAIIALWIVAGIAKYFAGIIGVAVVVAFCCGYVAARVVDEFHRHK